MEVSARVVAEWGKCFDMVDFFILILLYRESLIFVVGFFRNGGAGDGLRRYFVRRLSEGIFCV